MIHNLIVIKVIVIKNDIKNIDFYSKMKQLKLICKKTAGTYQLFYWTYKCTIYVEKIKLSCIKPYTFASF